MATFAPPPASADRDRRRRRLARLRAPVAVLAAIAALAALPGAATAAAGGPVLYVGDSLGVGTSPVLRTMLPAGSLEADARVGRSSTEGLAVLRSRLRPRHRIVIFDLGTNDWSVGTLTRNLGLARRHSVNRLMIVFTVNKPGAGPFNRALRAFAAATPNVALVDWHATASRERLLGGDGIHADASGYRRRAGLVAHQIAHPSLSRRARTD